MNLAVFQQALCLLYYRVQIFTLIYIIAVESVLFHVLDQILCAVSVVSDLQREYLVFFDQVNKPLIAIVIINEIVAGCAH